MKVTINREEKQQEVKFPRLVEKKECGAIFLQTSETWAVCIEPGQRLLIYPGKQIRFNPSGYTPFTGSITLSND